MPQDPLKIQETPGSREGIGVLQLTGPFTLSNIFEFQSLVRSNTSKLLVLDFNGVPYADSAGIGALVGAYVTHQKDGRSLALVGVNERIQNALEITRVHSFFRFYNSLADAEQAA